MIDRETPPYPLWLVGFGAWPTPNRAGRLVATLAERKVSRLVDVRLNPCASDVKEGRYGPKPWTLQAGRAGIANLLEEAGIAYEWLVELGNPQRHDKEMRVLHEHLADPNGGWPVHRGLSRLADLVRKPGEVVALLCACADGWACHRTVIARALADREFAGRLMIRDLRSGEPVRPPSPEPKRQGEIPRG
jgi:hypothetical protein